MKQHAAFGLGMEHIDAVVVDDSKPMQTIIRSILISFKVARVRIFDSVDEALEAMLAEPPNVILTDWRMEPASGYQLLRMVRHRHMEPLCYVPILFITAHGTRALVDKALRAGAHHLLVKPVSPSTLYRRLLWLMADSRPMVLENSGFYNIHGIHEALDAQAEKLKSLEGARQYHEQATRQLAAVKGAVAEAFGEETEDEAADIKRPAAEETIQPETLAFGRRNSSRASKRIRDAVSAEMRM